MSKVDALRAMREARYAQRQARPATTGSATAAPVVKRAAPAKAAPAEAAAADESLCGHKAISGRTCTREQGHAAKSHRYS